MIIRVKGLPVSRLKKWERRSLGGGVTIFLPRPSSVALPLGSAVVPYWIPPPDQHFADKVGCVLDLYLSIWRESFLGKYDYVLGCDEKTSI